MITQRNWLDVYHWEKWPAKKVPTLRVGESFVRDYMITWLKRIDITCLGDLYSILLLSIPRLVVHWKPWSSCIILCNNVGIVQHHHTNNNPKSLLNAYRYPRDWTWQTGTQWPPNTSTSPIWSLLWTRPALELTPQLPPTSQLSSLVSMCARTHRVCFSLQTWASPSSKRKWIFRGYAVCLEVYSPVLLLSYSISSVAFWIPDVLLS